MMYKRKNIMKKRFLILVLAAVLLAPTLVACGKSDENDGTSSLTAQSTSALSTTEETESISSRPESDSMSITDTSEASDIAEVDSTAASDSSSDTEGNEETTSSDKESESTEGEATLDTDDSTEADTNDVEITLNGGLATVSTKSGLSYSVKGFDEVFDGRFVFDANLRIDLGDCFSDIFNRFTLKYYSSAPLKIYLTYTENGKKTEELYFLEENADSFSGLTAKFLKRSKSKSLESIRIDTCRGEPAEFILYALSTEIMDVPDSTCYLEGNRYKLGIDLSWGGSISYLYDKSENIDGISNLVNKHDEGRLIQQSYYGTHTVEGGYQGGGKDGNWPYNPVQGGDAYAFDSRLIDLVIKDNSIYIKAQPLDWAKENVLTPSYMENEYVVEDEYIYVYNRFVDFSGFHNPARDQELPAVYTVNYFDTFVWYDGANPWTGDALSTISDWSNADADGKASQYVTLKSPNTETWCALISSKVDYGLGVYVPNVDKFLAMRYLSGLDGYMDGDGNPCSYFSPLNVQPIISYEPLEYSYIIATGSVEEMRSIFTKHKDFDTNDGLNIKTPVKTPYFDGTLENIDLSVPNGITSISNPHDTSVVFDEEKAAARFTVTGNDPYFSFSSTLSTELLAEDHGYIEIDYMIPKTGTDQSSAAQLFLCSGNITDPTQDAAVYCELITDGKYHTLRADVSEYSFWSGVIHSIRFDYFNSPNEGDVIYIKAFRLANE